MGFSGNSFFDLNSVLSGSSFKTPFQQASPLGTYANNPYTSALSTMIQNWKPVESQAKFTPVATTDNAYKAKDMSGTALPQFENQREMVNTEFNQQQQEGQDSLDRQFAAMGGGPGNGAQAKQTENLAAGIAKAKGQALSGINAQEAATRAGLQQQESEKEFQSGEAQTARNAQIGEFNASTALQPEEFNTQLAFQQSQIPFQQSSVLAGLETNWQEAEQQTAEAANEANFNAEMSQYQANHSGGLLGGGGFLGLGF